MLTLPNNNQLTGANSVLLDNGGTAAVNGSNNYTGVTTVGGNYINPSQAMGEAGAGTNLVTAPASVRVNSTLSVSNLANGGADEQHRRVGQWRVQPGAQRGNAQVHRRRASSDRLFTIQPNGTTLDASGTGPVNFTNTGAIVSADAPAGRTATIDSRIRVLYLDNVSDLTPGMTISGINIPPGSTVAALMTPSFGNYGNTGSNGPYQIILNQDTTAGPGTVVGPLYVWQPEPHAQSHRHQHRQQHHRRLALRLGGRRAVGREERRGQVGAQRQ